MRYFFNIIIFIKIFFSKFYYIKYLTINELKKNYQGSFFGILWTFLQPIAFITIIWFVFTFGLKIELINSEIPFFIWLVTGIIPWFFISEGILNGTNSINNNSFIVKKHSFELCIIPISVIGSVLITHIFLVLVLAILTIYNGFLPRLYWLQIQFYFICKTIFLLGLVLITSAISVFVKDTLAIINILILLAFWGTPIFWSAEILPKSLHYIIQINPIYFIVDGYRDIFLNNIWFWEKSFWSLYFVLLIIFIFVIGINLFNKLKVHFGDLL